MERSQINNLTYNLSKQKKNKINPKLAEGNNKDQSVDKQNREQKNKGKINETKSNKVGVTYEQK